MGVRISENFEPKYEITPNKKDVIKRLEQEAKKCGKVYLATDPDREGEAISWHLQTVLGLDENAANRIEFNEISPAAVQNALKNPRKININLVDAQQARRVLDRLVRLQSFHRFSINAYKTDCRRAEFSQSRSALSLTERGKFRLSSPTDIGL